MTALEDVLQQVRDRIDRYKGNRQINEQNTKASLIDPLLRCLGWDIEDPDEVHREYRVKSADKPVDYALLLLRTPRLFIEAKSLGENLDDRRWANQIMGYASVAGVEWVVLTNGDEYRIYNAHAAVPVDEKLFRCFRISQPSPLVHETIDLLSKERMRDNLIQTLWNAHFIDRQVRDVLINLFGTEPDPSLIGLIRKRLPNLARGDIRAALGRVRVQIDFPVIGPVHVAADASLQSVSAHNAPRRSCEPGDARVEMLDLIEAGLIDAPLELTRAYKGHILTARVEADGSISCLGRTYRSLSTAAGMALKSVIGSPQGRPYPATNGWIFWRFRAPDGREHEIDMLRQQYLQNRRASRDDAEPTHMWPSRTKG